MNAEKINKDPKMMTGIMLLEDEMNDSRMITAAMVRKRLMNEARVETTKCVGVLMLQ